EAGRELGRFDARGWLATVDVPTAVVRSTRDRLVSPASQAALAARIPTARRFDVDVDHDGHLARPDLVVPVLREAVADVLARRADG
ncbi:MAG: alpha/beta fold hydrolase, partial [Actinomycetota bacterium]